MLLVRDYSCMSCLVALCTSPACRRWCPESCPTVVPGDGSTHVGCGGRFCPTCLLTHVCITEGMVLQDLPPWAEVRRRRPRPCANSVAMPEGEVSTGTVQQSSSGGRIDRGMRFPLEHAQPDIVCWPDVDVPLQFCNGMAYDVPRQSLDDAFKSWFCISDCELFRLRRPHEYCCHDGTFLWLRPWHMVLYDDCPSECGSHGYVFLILVTGLRRGGWEPDIGAFFLEHPPHCGQWPVHYSKSMTWQLLLSTALGPAFCVCRESYATVRHAPPFHRADLSM